MTGQRGDLFGVEIVGRGEAVESERKIRLRGQEVRGVEAEVADERRVRLVLQRVKHPRGTHQNGAIEAQQEIEDARFAGL